MRVVMCLIAYEGGRKAERNRILLWAREVVGRGTIDGGMFDVDIPVWIHISDGQKDHL